MKVFLTTRNIDMTEGRGPMVNDLCFLKRRSAEDYVDMQSGVMGQICKWSKKPNNGQWEIEELKVIVD